MKEFYKRTLTGAILLVFLYGAIFTGPITFFVFASILNLLGIWEFYELIKKSEYKPQKISGFIAGFFTVAIFFLVASGLAEYRILFILLPLMFHAFIIELFRKSATPIFNLGLTLFAVLYISVPIGVLGFMAFLPAEIGTAYSPWIIGAYFLLLMVNDTAAYLVGVTCGKKRLFERISPKKSIEGAIGGLIFTLLLSLGISMYLPNFGIGITEWLLVGLIIVIFGNFGDLVESMFKRSLNVKHSGAILPGHGGVLDRFDAMFISAPFVLAVLRIIILN